MRAASRRASTPGPVTLHVERLVLDGLGLTRAQGAIVQRAFERELARLVVHSEQGAAWQGSRIPSVAATAVQTDGSVRPAQLGRDVARSVYSTLRKSP